MLLNLLCALKLHLFCVFSCPLASRRPRCQPLVSTFGAVCFFFCYLDRFQMHFKRWSGWGLLCTNRRNEPGSSMFNLGGQTRRVSKFVERALRARAADNWLWWWWWCCCCQRLCLCTRKSGVRWLKRCAPKRWRFP